MNTTNDIDKNSCSTLIINSSTKTESIISNEEIELLKSNIDEQEVRIKYLENKILELTLSIAKCGSEFRCYKHDSEKRIKKFSDKVDFLTDIVKSLDEEGCIKTLKKFHAGVKKMHEYNQNLFSKFCTLTEVNFVSKKLYPANHYDIMKRCIMALDEGEEFWEKIYTKTIGEIINVLLNHDFVMLTQSMDLPKEVGA